MVNGSSWYSTIHRQLLGLPDTDAISSYRVPLPAGRQHGIHLAMNSNVVPAQSTWRLGDDVPLLACYLRFHRRVSADLNLQPPHVKLDSTVSTTVAQVLLPRFLLGSASLCFHSREMSESKIQPFSWVWPQLYLCRRIMHIADIEAGLESSKAFLRWRTR